MKRRHFLSLAAASAVASSAAAQSVGWPQRPITLIVAFAAGGGTDVAARTLARFMEKDLGQSIVIVNRGGASGDIGWTEMVRSHPDGYTIGFINTPNLLTNPIERQTRYKLEDFAPIANVVDDPSAFFVRSDSPYRTVRDLIEFARANPEAVTYGTTGIGSDDHLAGLALERLTGVKLTHVPFTGSAPVRTALFGGQITVGSMNIGEGIMDARQGQIRALGQMATSRWSEAADTPTFREQGYDIVLGSMRGLAAPAGVPPEVLARLVQAARTATEDPEFRSLASQQALPLRFLGPQEFLAALITERQKYLSLWREHPWKE